MYRHLAYPEIYKSFTLSCLLPSFLYWTQIQNKKVRHNTRTLDLSGRLIFNLLLRRCGSVPSRPLHHNELHVEVARRGGYSSGGRGGVFIARRVTSNSHVNSTLSSGAARGPTVPQSATATNIGGTNQAQQLRVQQHRPPSANMITASQEQKGISHGHLESQTDSDRTLSGQVLESDLHNETIGDPDDSRAAPDTVIRAGRSETPFEVYERYRAQAERAERERDRGDPDFVLASQEARSPPFNGTIESQELEFLRQSTTNSLVDRTRGASRARQSDGPGQAQSSDGPDPHQPNDAHHTRRGSGPLQQEQDGYVEDHSMAGILRADASAAVTPASHRAKQAFGSPSHVSEMMLDDVVKRHSNKGKRTRNIVREVRA
ncbi:hypothetical protein EJ03DRAFT_50951 [Teratosphaeria nubilosa]|uniref:Uncharacterized protein n=1 Tax=Teratosphaeria nubilosa TaxID=161662 RepID=A0A6G1LEE0_9PEZI|nr:hypothetical protein EJ03DRAFT_50951 [Teratosphaeria nubilosa]